LPSQSRAEDDEERTRIAAYHDAVPEGQPFVSDEKIARPAEQADSIVV